MQRALLLRRARLAAGNASPEDLTTLQQAHQQAVADLADFKASTDTAEQLNYSNTVSGAQVDVAASNEILAERWPPPRRTSRSAPLKPENWNADMTLTIGTPRRWPTR